MAQMLTEKGVEKMYTYDPIYAPDASVWAREYDFIASTEVFEHLHRPALEIPRLLSRIKPGGLLGVMTSFVDARAFADAERFAVWYYIRDPTHVCFYSEETFRWIASEWKLGLAFPADNVAIFEKKKGL